MPKATEKKAICGENQAFNGVTRSCYSIVAPNKAAVAVNITPKAFNEDSESIITLSYTDADIDLATNCQVGNLSHITVSTPCSCTALGVCTVGVTGDIDYYGAAQFSYAVKTNNMVSNTALAKLIITNINDAPTISVIDDQTTTEDTSKSISFTINDSDNILTCAGSVTSSITNSVVGLVPAVVITGTAPNCMATISPGANLSGVSAITLQVSDGVLSTSSTFNLIVTSVNDAPSISYIANPTAVNEDNSTSVTFAIDDVDTSIACNISNISYSLVSTTGITPTISFSGTNGACMATITPGANQNGTVNIYFIVSDGQGGVTTSNPFTATFNAVNDAPTISTPANKTTLEDVALSNLAFTIDDIDNTLSCTSSVSVTTSNSVLTPSSRITITQTSSSGSTKTCALTINPAANQSGASQISLTVTDGLLTSSSNFTYNVTSVDDTLSLISSVATVDTNEGGMVVAGPFKIDEDAASSLDEDYQTVRIDSIVSDNTSVLANATASATSAIRVFYDSNDNGVEDAGEERFIQTNLESASLTTSTLSSAITTITDNSLTLASATSFPSKGLITIDTEDLSYTGKSGNILTGVSRGLNATTAAIHSSAATVTLNEDVSLHSFYLKLYPVAGISGNTNLTITLKDYTSGVAVNTLTTNLSLIVHPISAIHGGWSNISATGIKTDKLGSPIGLKTDGQGYLLSSSDIKCNYNKSSDLHSCGSSQDCKGTSAPHGNITPTVANILYWDSSAKKCYRSTSTNKYSWVDLTTSCPITRSSTVDNFIIDSTGGGVSAPTSTAQNQFYFDLKDKKCYQSKADKTWDTTAYTPSKITLSWNAFSVTGSTVAGWNVYRREAGQDYDYISGFLKLNSTDTKTITGSSTRSFTDTTAVAGKVYYYLVRPVDNTTRNLTVSTSEIFSEVRVFAPYENYAFVHRWMANQEICNSMHMTTSTTNKVDPTHNYRCPYNGPGETIISGTHYYDIGKDLLVDISESGCPYTVSSSTCPSEGCIGIGDPDTVLGAGIGNSNDIYYDRSAGSCYIYTSGAWNNYNAIDFTTATAPLKSALVAKTNSALNAPLTNLSQSQASNICSNRTLTTTLTTPTLTAALPSKKEFIAYSAAPTNTSDSDLTTLEQGYSLNIQSRCNSTGANGLESAFTDSSIPSSSYIYSLPGTASSGIRSLYTGSIPWVSSYSTESCSSRYGIQDVYGNVAEWVQDKMSCYSLYPKLTSNIGTSETTIAVTSTAGFPASGTLQIDSEQMTYTLDTTYSFLVTRSTPVSHTSSTAVIKLVASSTLSYDIGVSDTYITVADASVFPSSGSVIIGTEEITYTGKTSSTLTGLFRASYNTTAVSHLSGATVTYKYRTNYTCNSLSGTDLGTYDFGNGNIYGFNYYTGPYNDVSANSMVDNVDSFLTQWIFKDEVYTAGKFSFPTGMPINVDIGTLISSSGALTNLLDIGPTSGITTSQMHEDGIIVNGALVNNATTNPTQKGSFAQGGSYLSGDLAGRYFSELVPDVTVRSDIGFRCYIPIDSVNFPVDTGRHTYSY